MPLSHEEIRRLIHNDEGGNALSGFYLKTLSAAVNYAAKQVGQSLMDGASAPPVMGSMGTVISAGFRQSGFSKEGSKLAGSIGKFTILSISLGPAGALMSMPNVVFSVFAYLNADEERVRNKMRDEIMASVQDKIDRITQKMNAIKQQAANRDGIGASGDENDPVLFWMSGTSVSANAIAATNDYLGDPRIGGKDEALILASFYAEHAKVIEAYRRNGNKHPDNIAEAIAVKQKAQMISQIIEDRESEVTADHGESDGGISPPRSSEPVFDRGKPKSDADEPIVPDEDVRPNRDLKEMNARLHEVKVFRSKAL